MRKVKVLTGILLILIGVGIYIWPSLMEWRLARQTDSLIAEFQATYQQEESGDSTGAAAGGETTDASEDRNEDSTAKKDSGEEAVSSADEETAEAFTEVEDGEPAEELSLSSNVDLDGLLAAMQDYNQALIDHGQRLTDAWSYEQEPIRLSDYYLENNIAGYIQIPDMEVTLPLYLGANADNLKSGAAVLSQTSMPIGGASTNCVIAGHRGYSGMAFFRDIEKLTYGSVVYITNPWETLTYRVTGMRLVEPDDVDSVLIQEGKDMVTLITCHPYMSGGQYRYLVYCQRADDAEETWDTSESGSLEEPETGQELYVVTSDGQKTWVESSEGLIQAEKIIRTLVLAILIACVLILLLSDYDRSRRRRRKGRKAPKS
ncbi:MAG: class C sortase [Lachnospiraceae bacterium]|nr:class C sortase [Lachnospiraceae bacterium]